MAEWHPVLDRGDGVWLGVIGGGALGVGSRDAVAKRIIDDNYVPLWPLLEQDFDETLTLLSANWRILSSSGLDTPETLMQRVVDSAVKGGRPYWVELATHWLATMAVHDRFDHVFVRDSLEQVAHTVQATQSARHEARRTIRSMAS
jgi:hypothetical protein